MAQKNALERLNKIWDVTVGKGAASSKGELRKAMDKSGSQITIDVKLFVTGLEKQYKKRTGTNAPKDFVEDYESLTKEILNTWESFVGTENDDEYKLDKKLTKTDILVFDMFNVNAKAGTYKKFQKKNQEITDKLIKNTKYSYLFQGRSEVGKGDKKRVRAIFDVGHKYSVTESGRAGVASGLAKDGLKDDTVYNRLTDKDCIKSAERKKLKKLKGLIGLFSEERMKVTVSNGKLQISNRIFLELDTDTQNRAKSKDEQKAGKLVEDQIKDIIGQPYTPEEIANAKGSPSGIDHIADMIINTPTKKKAYGKGTAKNLTKYKKPLGSKDKTNKAEKKQEFESNRDSVLISGLTPEIARSLPRGPGRPRTEKGKGDTDFAIAAAGLLTVKRAINKRLPEEVRRNMGRPALRYQTGRFARSTMIESITPAARTLLVKYTYRLNPYETFESTGKRKWPSGYNPKPLISKSIRNLALSMFKLEALTTRRV